MLDTLATLRDPSKVTEEQITKAYEILKEYCYEKGLDLLETINSDKNIRPAAEEIHRNLSWVLKKTIKVDKIEELISTNVVFIREKALEQIKKEKQAAKEEKKSKKDKEPTVKKKKN